MTGTTAEKLTFLKDLWNDSVAKDLEKDPLGLLRYRSNLLGTDYASQTLREGTPVPRSTWPIRLRANRPCSCSKRSGGDLGSITDRGFALLYLDKLEQSSSAYQAKRTKTNGRAFILRRLSDKPRGRFRSIHRCMASFRLRMWTTCTGLGDRDSGKRNGKQKMEEFNERFHRQLVWLPWQRPGLSSD